MNPVSVGGGYVVLVILAMIWAAALLPPFVRSRLEGDPVDSIGRFRRHLRVLESTGPAASALASDPLVAAGPHVMPAAWASEARRLRKLRRRRQVALSLLIVMGSTLVLGAIPGLHLLWVVQALADVAFFGYLVLLARARAYEATARMEAHFAALRAEDPELDLGELRSQAF